MLRTCLIIFCCCCLTAGLTAQGKARSFQLKKGQVIDFLLLDFSTDTAARKRYFAEVIPVGVAGGYEPGPSFRATEAATQGNYHPDVLAFGAWTDVAAREATAITLEKEIDDFHGQRRRVWTNFRVQYFELTEDLDFRTDPTKYYVITTFWADATGGFSGFLSRWEKQQKRYGGTPILTLTDGYSPLGYQYDPDYLTITEWASEADFRAFLEKDRKADRTGIVHLNQFRLQ
ncbi:MAG: hypothetical protein AAFN92_20970 [Bacteroidota bacterium]